MSFLLSFTLPLLGCTNSTVTTVNDSGDHGHAETCGEDGDHYMAGMAVTGEQGKVTLVLVSSDPGPPEKGDNLFEVSVEDIVSASMVDDAAVLLRPWMSEHGHGSSPETWAVITTGEGGLYNSEPVNLFMGGLWELTFEVTLADGQSDSGTFTFCVEG